MFDAEKRSAPGNQKAQALYDLGSTTVYASRHDARFPYVLYVPPEVLTPGNDVQLVVAMHGTGRQFTQYRDAFAPFGRWNRCIVLCPLFPVGVRGDGDRNGFKRLIDGDIRYDQVLLDMVSEVGERYGKRFEQFALFGYSGGGQYVNRFAYAHPERLWPRRSARRATSPCSITRKTGGWASAASSATSASRSIWPHCSACRCK